MQVKFVSVTKGEVKTENGFQTLMAEELIVYTARVSNPGNQSNLETAPKLINHLIRNGHWSPFEMASMTLEIVTSRGIAPQILRHRSFSFQEFSLRYAEAVEREVYPARRQDTKNRQNSIDDMSQEDQHWFLCAQADVWELSKRLYNRAIEKGLAKEQARFLLPLSTQTKLYMCGTVRSWIHYLQVRDKPGVQKEHRDIAVAAKKIFKEQFPNVTAALEW